MALSDSLRSRLPSIRAIPGKLGLRPNAVYILRRGWVKAEAADQSPGVGSRYEDERRVTEGDQNPKVRQLSDERLALAGLQAGSIEIGPVTPGHSTTLADLRGAFLEDKERLFIRISGPLSGIYRISGLTVDRAMHYMITAVPVEGDCL